MSRRLTHNRPRRASSKLKITMDAGARWPLSSEVVGFANEIRGFSELPCKGKTRYERLHVARTLQIKIFEKKVFQIELRSKFSEKLQKNWFVDLFGKSHWTIVFHRRKFNIFGFNNGKFSHSWNTRLCYRALGAFISQWYSTLCQSVSLVAYLTKSMILCIYIHKIDKRTR